MKNWIRCLCFAASLFWANAASAGSLGLQPEGFRLQGTALLEWVGATGEFLATGTADTFIDAQNVEHPVFFVDPVTGQPDLNAPGGDFLFFSQTFTLPFPGCGIPAECPPSTALVLEGFVPDVGLIDASNGSFLDRVGVPEVGQAMPLEYDFTTGWDLIFELQAPFPGFFPAVGEPTVSWSLADVPFVAFDASIPEPSSAGLLGLGLLLLTALRRRG